MPRDSTAAENCRHFRGNTDLASIGVHESCATLQLRCRSTSANVPGLTHPVDRTRDAIRSVRGSCRNTLANALTIRLHARS